MVSHLRMLCISLCCAGGLALSLPLSASAAYHVPYGSEAIGAGLLATLYYPTYVPVTDNGCRPSAQHPYPVVLVQTTLANEGSNWVTLAPLLADNGCCVYAFNYGATQHSLGGRIDALDHIERPAEELSTFLDRMLAQAGARQIDLVGHSQGGMMPNHCLGFLGGAPKVHMLIGLAPSNHGTI
ncbi:MAG TPA: alpha/beta fold hydrolase [Solirubrobacteraceae bacterium]|nr:alpha/beta fold hydrolase [Solirubrobacteraceae bacterium]